MDVFMTYLIEAEYQISHILTYLIEADGQDRRDVLERMR